MRVHVRFCMGEYLWVRVCARCAWMSIHVHPNITHILCISSLAARTGCYATACHGHPVASQGKHQPLIWSCPMGLFADVLPLPPSARSRDVGGTYPHAMGVAQRRHKRRPATPRWRQLPLAPRPSVRPSVAGARLPGADVLLFFFFFFFFFLGLFFFFFFLLGSCLYRSRLHSPPTSHPFFARLILTIYKAGPASAAIRGQAQRWARG